MILGYYLLKYRVFRDSAKALSGLMEIINRDEYIVLMIFSKDSCFF